MMHDAVDHGGRRRGVVEDFAPAPEGQIGGDEQAATLVHPGDEAEEQVGADAVKRYVAQFVEDDQFEAREVLQLATETVGRLWPRRVPWSALPR